MRILALLTDAFGGYGGISVANRHFLRGLCAWELCDEVVAVPMFMPHEPEAMPERLTYHEEATSSKSHFVFSALRAAWREGPYDAIWCGHIDLVTFSVFLKQVLGVQLILHMHGIDTWDPPDKKVRQVALRGVDAFISVSETTKRRFLRWAPLCSEQGYVLPNTIDFTPFSPGPKRPDLVERYGLQGRYVIMTMGRLVSKGRAKGFDAVLDVLPRVAACRPNVTYLIAGKGPDRPRLEEKARELGIRDRVVFTGYVPEAEKADYYRLADRYVMPSQGEGFGLVLLEAMACGIPVVASTADGSREAVLNGRLGLTVDPEDPDAVARSMIVARDALPTPNPGQLRRYFGPDAFNKRLHSILSSVFMERGAAFAR